MSVLSSWPPSRVPSTRLWRSACGWTNSPICWGTPAIPLPPTTCRRCAVAWGEFCRSCSPNWTPRASPPGFWVQTVAPALRPGLADFHPRLARTAEKYVLLLDALEDMHADLTFARPPPLAAETARPRRQASRQAHPRSVLPPLYHGAAA